MIIGVPKETAAGENRVALIPETAAKLIKAGFQIQVEKGAGAKAFYSDADYQKAGVTVTADVFSADIVVKIAAPSMAEIARLKSGTVYIGFLNPLADPSLSVELAKRGVTAFSMELVPRTSRDMPS